MIKVVLNLKSILEFIVNEVLSDGVIKIAVTISGLKSISLK
jgi:hypothetical protein